MLIKTKDYKPYKYHFNSFNPVQTKTLNILKNNSNNNVLLSANTSSGKTICAEFLIDTVLKKGNKIVYLCPLKALAEERFLDWSKRFENEKIIIVTGDYSNKSLTSNKLNKSDIIIMTSEMLDVKTRNYKSKENFWLFNVGLLVLDEFHIISSENRGAAIETSLLRFTLLNKKARILALSATMSNCSELKSWLTMLNGNYTDVVESTWRPIELAFHYPTYVPVFAESGYFNYFRTETEKFNTVIPIVLNKVETEKFLIFVHSKSAGRILVKQLKKEGIDSIFHNADLPLKGRRKIEENFRSKDGSIRVLISTSTLAWGVNLPARNVIIVGVKRGMSNVDPLDVIQMAGRAGRYGIDTAGDVYLVLPIGDVNKWKDNLVNPRPLQSKLETPSILAFHVLAEINNGFITNSISLRRWYRKTLRFLQTRRIPLPIEHTLLNSLEKMIMIEKEDNKFITTKLGKISSRLYFSPYDIFAWYSNLRKSADLIDDCEISRLIFDVPKNENWVPKDMKDYVSLFNNSLVKRGIKINNIKSLLHVLAGYQLLTGTEDLESGILNSIKREILFDLTRVISAIKLIAFTLPFKIATIKSIGNFLSGIELRLKYGIPIDAVELVGIKGIGTKRAIILLENNIITIEDIIKNKRKIIRLFSPVIYKNIIKNINQKRKEL